MERTGCIRWTRSWRITVMKNFSFSTRRIVAIGIIASLLLLLASPASAHDPIFVTDDQTSPDTGPFMPDGSISWALYGTVLEEGDTRGFEFDLRDGDELYISLLVPNIEPEISLSDEVLPIVELEAPDGTTTTIVPEVREVFDEPFSGTSYITLAELREPGQAGRYRGLLIGNGPSRFTVAIGEEELFFTETERTGDRPSSFQEIGPLLNAWYTTPAGEEPVETEGEEDIEIDTEMIEEAMEDGEAEVPESAFENGDEPVAESDEATVEEGSATEAEEASDDTSSDDDGSNGWVAPTVLALAGLIGGLWFLRSRRSASGDRDDIDLTDRDGSDKESANKDSADKDSANKNSADEDGADDQNQSVL